MEHAEYLVHKDFTLQIKMFVLIVEMDIFGMEINV